MTQVVSYRRAGRLLPRRAAGLRAGAVVLRPGNIIDWHSTKSREELLIAMQGLVRVEVKRPHRTPRRVPLKNGACLWLPPHTWHRVVNESTKLARYLYITAPAT
ncbi:MAG: cupin domain-containing protein [Candidatus Omnitrophota bacterium]|nr:cupin domain-containing protein [Candidatus Omnitrophota bacterium]